MSNESITVTKRHFAYLAERTRGEDAFLRDLKAAALEAGLPPIWISPEQASLLQILLKLRGAKTAVDVGTLAGYSAVWLARALPPDGHVHTIEVNPAHAAFAKEWIAKSDVAGRITVHVGDAREVLKTFGDASADAVFLDADKRGYPAYLAEGLRILRPRGLVLADNAFAFGELFSDAPKDSETEAVREFNELMANTPGLHGIIMPIGDGCWVAVKES